MLTIYAPWANEMTTDQKKDLINHLKILCARKIISEPELSFVRDICIRVLEKHDGQINQTWEFVKLAQKHGHSPADIYTTVTKYHEWLKRWVDTNIAAQYMNLSMGHVQRLAKRGIPYLEAIQDKRHHWKINPASINDWFLRTKRVRIN